MRSALLLSILSLASGLSAMANPIADMGVEKTSERCLIHLYKESAVVSCGVVYRVVSYPKEEMFISVPIFFPNDGTDEKQVVAKAHPRLEFEGTVHEPNSVSKCPFEKSTPEGLVRMECSFSFRPKMTPAVSQSFAIVVSYDQPLIDGKAYYLPLFESDKTPPNRDAFTISFFPDSQRTLELLSKHEDRATEMKTRVTIHPKDKEMIVVRSSDGK
jgi:hypothetical protein